jgi:hypothetical protein
MSSPAHKFDLQTITFGDKPPVRVSAFCYKGLGAVRIDQWTEFLAPGIELWTVTILRNNTLFPIVPVFKNIDNATGFIWDISEVFDWTTELTQDDFRRIHQKMAQILFHHNAYPLEKILEKSIPKEELERFTVPMPLGPR